jgi:hypothetical protein
MASRGPPHQGDARGSAFRGGVGLSPVPTRERPGPSERARATDEVPADLQAEDMTDRMAGSGFSCWDGCV